MVSERDRRFGPVGTVLRAWVAVVVLWACAGLAPPPAAAQGAADYRLSAGDRIKVTVFGHEDLSGEFEIDGSGNVSLPLVRNVGAQGLTLPELESAIAERLKPDYLKDPSVSIEVLNYRPFYIYGEVNQPGSYPYASGMTVDKAIATAGGFSYRARKSRVKIVRANDPSRTPQEASHDTPILPGDIIEVPERYF
ncbi:MAG: polysaccharide biosynthesis/export family protein [Rhodospirillales bacterium]